MSTCLTSHPFDCTLFYSRPTQTTHGHWPSGPGQYSRRQCQWRFRHSTKSDQRNLDEEMEYLLTTDEKRSRDRGSANRALPPWPGDPRLTAIPRMGLPPERSSSGPRPSPVTPRWRIIWFDNARRQEDIRGLQYRQPLVNQRMGMAVWSSAGHARIWAMAAPHSLPNCAKSDPLTNRDQGVVKGRQAKAPNHRQGRLGSLLETRGAPYYPRQRPQTTPRHHQILLRGHDGEAWRGKNQAQEVLQAKHRVHQQSSQKLCQYGVGHQYEKTTNPNSGEEDSYSGAQSMSCRNSKAAGKRSDTASRPTQHT